MPKIRFAFTGVARIVLEHEKGTNKSSLKETQVFIEPEEPLISSMYEIDGAPTKEGAGILNLALLSGIVTNIKYAHSKGYLNEVEEVKRVVNEITRQFAETPADMGIGYFRDDSPIDKSNG